LSFGNNNLSGRRRQIRRITDLSLIFREQLSARKKVFIFGKGDDRLWQLSKVKLQE